MYDWIGISQRRLKRATKAQTKDLKKVRDYRDRIAERNQWDEKSQRLAQAYNRRDQKRIDKLVDRCEARALRYGIATYKPPTPADAIAQASVALRDVRDALKGHKVREVA